MKDFELLSDEELTDILEQHTNPDNTKNVCIMINIRDNITHNYSNLESFDNFDDYGG